MLISAVFIFLITAVYLILNYKDKFKYVIALYIVSISMMMVVCVIYVNKLSNYAAFSQIDYRLFRIFNSFKLNVPDVARLLNLCIALFMLASVIAVVLLKKCTIPFRVMLLLPVVLFLVLNDPLTTWIFFLKSSPPNHSVLIEQILSFSRPFSLFCVLSYSVAPLLLLGNNLVQSKIHVKRKDCLISIICLLLFDTFVFSVFFLGPFHILMFYSVDLMKFPYTDFQYGGSVFIPISILFIVLAVIILTLYFKPFGGLVFITRNEIARNARQVNQNLKMILHTYKNAFLGVEKLTALTEGYIRSDQPDRALYCSAQMKELAESSLKTITHTLEMMKNVNLKSRSVNLLECIDSALVKCCPPEEIRILKNYDSAHSERVSVYGDFSHLQEVFTNLLANAVHALNGVGDDPTIEIRVMSESDLCAVEILDNGCGIAKKDLKNIFRPFYSTKPNSDGCGIGLSYVEAVVKQHHGSIQVKSEVNQYTRFQIVLPLDYSQKNSKTGGK